MKSGGFRVQGSGFRVQAFRAKGEGVSKIWLTRPLRDVRLRECYAMSGTELPYPATGLRAR
eukprot:3940321-Rhodomonas_salina.1